MTIYNGSQGSLNLFYNGLLISSFPLTNKKTFERYKYQGEYLILKSMKQNIKIKQMIICFKSYCNLIYKRKKNNQPIKTTDHQMFLSTLFALMKLKQLDNDESNGYLIMPRKKLPKLKTSYLK